MKFNEFLKKAAKQREYGLWHQMFYRYLSLPFIWLFLLLKIPPNLISFIGLALKLSGLYNFITFNWIPAIILYQIGITMDWCDGAVARLTNKTSPFGAKLDSIIDIVINRLFFITITLTLFLYYQQLLFLILGFALFIIMWARETICAEADKQEQYSTKREASKNKAKSITTIFTIIINGLKVGFPFIVFLPFTYILYFFYFHIIIEIIRIIFYSATLLKTVKN